MHSVHVHPAPICRPSLDDCSRKKRRAPTVSRRFSLVRRLTRRPAPESAEARATGGAAGARGGAEASTKADCRREGNAKTAAQPAGQRWEEHTSELQSLMRIPSAVFCLKKKMIPQEKQPHYPSQSIIVNTK